MRPPTLVRRRTTVTGLVSSYSRSAIDGRLTSLPSGVTAAANAVSSAADGSTTRPGSAAFLTDGRPLPCLSGLDVDSVSVAVVRNADAVAPGGHDGCSAFRIAAIPATCGAAIEVPEKASNDRPASPLGETAAMTSMPSATRSGFCRPVWTGSGPYEERPATLGSPSTLVPSPPGRSEAVPLDW